jgi:hypothetical protein
MAGADAFTLQLIHEPGSLDDGNIDAIVTVPGRGRFGITFFTVANLRTLMDRYEQSGECDGGRWFWAVDMLFVRDLRRETLELAVAGAIREGGDRFLRGLTVIDD